MKKIKEKIEEFKAKPRKEKIRKIVDIVFLGVLIIILAILMAGFFVSRGDKSKTAGAIASNNPEMTQTIYKTRNGELDKGVYMIGHVNWQNENETRSYSVGYMEILDGNTWRRIKTIEEVRQRSNVAITFNYEGGKIINKISMFVAPVEASGIQWDPKMNIRGKINVFEDVKMRWDGVINYVGGRLQLYTEYMFPRFLMLYTNINTFDIQETMDYPNGFFESGYNAGYKDGYNKGTDQAFNPIGMIINPVAQLFSTPIFGNFAIGDFFTVAMFVSVALIFLKIFAGG